jgi:hypothetical protein
MRGIELFEPIALGSKVTQVLSGFVVSKDMIAGVTV